MHYARRRGAKHAQIVYCRTARLTLGHQQMVMDEPSSVTKEYYVYLSWCRCPHHCTCIDFPVSCPESTAFDFRPQPGTPEFSERAFCRHEIKVNKQKQKRFRDVCNG
jgi:hypothetical protein